MKKKEPPKKASLSRREFLKTAVVMGGGAIALGKLAPLRAQEPPGPPGKATLFETVKVGKLELRNRLVRSATAERAADADGNVTDQMVAIYRNLAAGGVGVIISGHAFVRPDGRLGDTMMGIYRDEQVKGIARLAETAHEHGAKLVVQINHAGLKAQPGVPVPLGPSVPQRWRGEGKPREMNTDDIAAVVKAFGEAARRVREGGADGVQVHAAHGFLVNQFLSPASNRHADDWGGSDEKRGAFLKAVYDSVRNAVGPDFPVWAKINGMESIKGGRTVEECLAAAERLAAAGVDLIEISGLGGKKPEDEKAEGPPYYLAAAEAFRPKIKTPLSLVGGIRSLETMERLVGETGVDLVSVARPLIRDPALPKKLAKGTVKVSSCKSCSECLKHGDEPIRCWQPAD
ncbi:MAG: NADH:flavin oxidoreductase [Planctomycetota bacterium]|nr:NADH:flavin oxidoreductase [Planctomycetota bacterium]